ncbi:MAG: hypothetical protein ACLP6E_17225 [Acidimicrobiales bacterium]
MASAAALVVALVGASPAPSGTSAGAAVDTVYVVPTSVNGTCKHDVTYALGNWLLSVPNGTPGHDSVIELDPGACYEVNGSIWWRGARNIVLDGNGATIKQESVTVPDKIVGSKNNPAVAPYCGSTANMNDRYSAIYTNVLLLDFEGGCNITVENLKIIGTHTGIGTTSKLQPDTFISFSGTKRALVDNVTMRGPYGDYVDVGGLHEAVGYPAFNITIEHSTFADSGREGISEGGNAHRVTIEDNVFTGNFESTATVFDIEVDVVYRGAIDTDILITHNRIVGESYAFLLSAQTKAELQRVAFNDNTLTGSAQMRIYISPYPFGGGANNSIEIEGNTSDSASAWPWRSPVNVDNARDVLVKGNIDPVPLTKNHGKTVPFAAFTHERSNLACGNRTPSGVNNDAACPPVSPTITPPALAVLPS